MAELVLDPSQECAVELVLDARFGMVTGGPGVGKTTCLREALRRLDARGDDGYELAAPTGKAARRMHEATGREARTIHRLLEYGPQFGDDGRMSRMGFRRGETDPLDSTLVIVDEASMLDIELARALLEAIDGSRTRLVLVGDANQLPSVGPGRVFADLVESGDVPVARLTTLHRAAQESWICSNAPVVLAGKVPDLQGREDFEWHGCADRDAAAARVLDLIVRQLPRRGLEAQVLVPQNTGPAGTVALNAELQARLNPPRVGERSWGKAPNVLRPRDRVIQLRNDYVLGVFNGEVGDVVSVGGEGLTVRFEGREPVRYDRMQASALKLAYALTIHKSQGSEWPWVVVLCHSTHAFMLSRQLLYTAITRAKEGVVLVGDPKGLKLALKNVAPARRNTSLVERLREASR